VKVLNGFTAVSLQGVELQKFGKEQLGSYPIHFHKDGNITNKNPKDMLIDSNSIDHSYNKCITVHSTQGASFTNNVCARITGHIFYEEVGDETNVTFQGNLGMGAMSNSFDVNTTAEADKAGDRETLIDKYYWVGDHMFARPIPKESPFLVVFDQFNIFDTDNQYVANTGKAGTFASPRGQCATLKYSIDNGNGFNSNGGVYTLGAPDNTKETRSCWPGNNADSPPGKGNVYFEPPSGFWLLNPSAKIKNNSIAGCQDTGAAYWYATPPDASIDAAKFIPIGDGAYPTDPTLHGVFQNNRGHGCYRGLNDDPFELGTADQLFGYQSGKNDGGITHPLVDEFDGLILSRIRYRGVWLRPSFFYLKDARLALIRRGLSFVTSGGADGNYPGVWSLLGHSTIVGMSQNNVDRFGPCGKRIIVNGVGQVRGAQWGCIDQTQPVKGVVAAGGEFSENGFPVPDHNLLGFMSYDGPPLLVNVRFVNFKINPATAKFWTKTDQDVVNTWGFLNGYKHYEGDAAIGWLDSNQSAYPTAASTKNLYFTNVDLRHQVYTDKVNIGTFNDGDKNTAILDLDGTLSGYAVVDKNASDSHKAFPISLNNLEINASSNSVDECHAEGQQNTDLEGRPSAAMMPTGVGQLELETLYPRNGPPWPPVDPVRKIPNFTQLLTFYKDTLDFGQHGSMALHSRNGNGIWEPKVSSSYGYVVRADTYTDPSYGTSGVGIPNVVDVSLVDTVKPNISADNPFYVQIGICYTNLDGTHPANKFTVTHGYKSWGGGNYQPTDQLLRKYFNQLNQRTDKDQFCDNLDSANPKNMGADGATGCPSDGVAVPNDQGKCPSGSSLDSNKNCVFPKNTPQLSPAGSLAEMTTDKTLYGPPDLTKYFYDSGTGMLYLWVAQIDANAEGPSPLGNCTGGNGDSAFCPQLNKGINTGETYYNCPAEGCSTYRVTLNDQDYKPGQSKCDVFGGGLLSDGWAKGTGGATWTKAPVPPGDKPLPSLVPDGSTNPVERVAKTDSTLPHYADKNPPTCGDRAP
jgi:hypothetical protein